MARIGESDGASGLHDAISKADSVSKPEKNNVPRFDNSKTFQADIAPVCEKKPKLKEPDKKRRLYVSPKPLRPAKSKESISCAYIVGDQDLHYNDVASGTGVDPEKSKSKGLDSTKRSSTEWITRAEFRRPNTEFVSRSENQLKPAGYGMVKQYVQKINSNITSKETRTVSKVQKKKAKGFLETGKNSAPKATDKCQLLESSFKVGDALNNRKFEGESLSKINERTNNKVVSLPPNLKNHSDRRYVRMPERQEQYKTTNVDSFSLPENQFANSMALLDTKQSNLAENIDSSTIKNEKEILSSYKSGTKHVKAVEGLGCLELKDSEKIHSKNRNDPEESVSKGSDKDEVYTGLDVVNHLGSSGNNGQPKRDDMVLAVDASSLEDQQNILSETLHTQNSFISDLGQHYLKTCRNAGASSGDFIGKSSALSGESKYTSKAGDTNDSVSDTGPDQSCITAGCSLAENEASNDLVTAPQRKYASLGRLLKTRHIGLDTVSDVDKPNEENILADGSKIQKNFSAANHSADCCKTDKIRFSNVDYLHSFKRKILNADSVRSKEDTVSSFGVINHPEISKLNTSKFRMLDDDKATTGRADRSMSFTENMTSARAKILDVMSSMSDDLAVANSKNVDQEPRASDITTYHVNFKGGNDFSTHQATYRDNQDNLTYQVICQVDDAINPQEGWIPMKKLNKEEQLPNVSENNSQSTSDHILKDNRDYSTTEPNQAVNLDGPPTRPEEPSPYRTGIRTDYRYPATSYSVEHGNQYASPVYNTRSDKRPRDFRHQQAERSDDSVERRGSHSVHSGMSFESCCHAHRTVPVGQNVSGHRINRTSESNQSYPTSESEGPVCRICQEGDVQELLVSPCYCAGSLGLLHISCLQKWLGASNKTNCEICNFEFSVERKPMPVSQFIRDPGSVADRRNIVCDMICACLISPLTMITTYLCISGAMKYYTVDHWERMGLLILSGVLVVLYFIWLAVMLKQNYTLWQDWKMFHQEVTLLAAPKVTFGKKDQRGSAMDPVGSIRSRSSVEKVQLQSVKICVSGPLGRHKPREGPGSPRLRSSTSQQQGKSLPNPLPFHKSPASKGSARRSSSPSSSHALSSVQSKQLQTQSKYSIHGSHQPDVLTEQYGQDYNDQQTGRREYRRPDGVYPSCSTWQNLRSEIRPKQIQRPKSCERELSKDQTGMTQSRYRYMSSEDVSHSHQPKYDKVNQRNLDKYDNMLQELQSGFKHSKKVLKSDKDQSWSDNKMRSHYPGQSSYRSPSRSHAHENHQLSTIKSAPSFIVEESTQTPEVKRDTSLYGIKKDGKDKKPKNKSLNAYRQFSEAEIFSRGSSPITPHSAKSAQCESSTTDTYCTTLSSHEEQNTIL